MQFYYDEHGKRFWVTPSGRVKVWSKTHTSNPHQPCHKWIQTARPKDPAAYAAKKVAAGEWIAETSFGLRGSARRNTNRRRTMPKTDTLEIRDEIQKLIANAPAGGLFHDATTETAQRNAFCLRLAPGEPIVTVTITHGGALTS